MIRQTATMFLLVLVTFLNAQEKILQLPKSNYAKEIRHNRKLSITINEKETIFLEKEKVSLNELRIKLFTAKIPNNDYDYYSIYKKLNHIEIVADKSVSYSIIDAVKTEVASTGMTENVIYRTQSNGEVITEGIEYKLPKSFFLTTPQKQLYPRHILKRKDSLDKKNKVVKLRDLQFQVMDLQSQIRADSIMPLIPEVNDPVWNNPTLKAKFPFPYSYNYEKVLYSVRRDVIEDKFSDVDYKCLTIGNNGLKDVNGSIISSLKFSEIEACLLKNRVLIIYTEQDLIYQNYLRLVEVLQKVAPLEESINGKYCNVVEISNQMKQLHKRFNIKLSK